MAQYLLSVWHDDDYEVDFSTDDMQQQIAQVGAFNAELESTGSWVFGCGLHPASTAAVLRLAGDQISTSDGPYAQSTQQMGGFWVIEAGDREAALEWGRKATMACGRPVEVRPLQGE